MSQTLYQVKGQLHMWVPLDSRSHTFGRFQARFHQGAARKECHMLCDATRVRLERIVTSCGNWQLELLKLIQRKGTLAGTFRMGKDGANYSRILYTSLLALVGGLRMSKVRAGELSEAFSMSNWQGSFSGFFYTKETKCIGAREMTRKPRMQGARLLVPRAMLNRLISVSSVHRISYRIAV
jgi:hypothetical protein